MEQNNDLLKDIFNIENIFEILPNADKTISNKFNFPLGTVIFFILSAFILWYIYVKKRIKRYKSGQMKITDEIYIPEKAGEGQYGTASFLPRRKFKKAFKSNMLDYENPIVKELLKDDIDENEEINKINDEMVEEKKTEEPNDLKIIDENTEIDINDEIQEIYFPEENEVLSEIDDTYESNEDEFISDGALKTIEEYNKERLKQFEKFYNEKKEKEAKETKVKYERKKDKNVIFKSGGLITGIEKKKIIKIGIFNIPIPNIPLITEDIYPFKKIPILKLIKPLNKFKIPHIPFLTRDANEIFYIDTDTHSVTIGATRSGKSRCLVMETIGNLGLAGESIVVTDPKGELADYTVPFMKKLGYEVIILDFKNPNKSSKYNLLQPIIDAINDNDMDRAVNYTEEITNILVGDPKQKDIWYQGNRAIISGSILANIIANKDHPEKQNFSSIYRFMTDGCKYLIDNENKIDCDMKKFNEYLQYTDPEHPTIDSLAPIVNSADDTFKSFVSGATNIIRLYTQRSIWQITHKTETKLTEIGERKQILYIILPDENTMYYSIASILVSQLYNELVKVSDKYGGRLPIRVNFVLDEFGNFAKVPDLDTKLTVGGGRGMRFNLFLQSFAQMVKKYEKETEKILKSNCETWVYLQADEPDTLKEISGKLGKYTINSNSISISGQGSGKTSESTSQNLCGRDLLTPDELKKIHRPYLLVTSRNDPAIMTAPDISQLAFNKMYNMGDPVHNNKLRMVRAKNRPNTSEPYEPQYWQPFIEDRKFLQYYNLTPEEIKNIINMNNNQGIQNIEENQNENTYDINNEIEISPDTTTEEKQFIEIQNEESNTNDNTENNDEPMDEDDYLKALGYGN